MVIYRPPVCSSSSYTPFSVKRGSRASIARKNPSLVARLKRSQLNIGWFQRGNRFMICHAKNAENAANSTVNSNMIGKNAGTVKKFVGLPWTSSGYRIDDGPNSTSTAVSNPEIPPNRTQPLSHDLPSPIAPSIPWIENGEYP